MGIWQFIAGGGEEEDISIIESAKREAFEEAGISKTCNFFKLDTCCSIPSIVSRTQKQYGVKNVSSFRSTHLR